VAIAAEPDQCGQLRKIMAWMEGLTNSTDMEVRNLVATSIGEPLVASYDDVLPIVFPYLGSRTKEFCKVIFVFFKVSDATKLLFKDVALIESIRD
jgi:hypothetical protein